MVFFQAFSPSLRHWFKGSFFLCLFITVGPLLAQTSTVTLNDDDPNTAGDLGYAVSVLNHDGGGTLQFDLTSGSQTITLGSAAGGLGSVGLTSATTLALIGGSSSPLLTGIAGTDGGSFLDGTDGYGVTWTAAASLDLGASATLGLLGGTGGSLSLTDSNSSDDEEGNGGAVSLGIGSVTLESDSSLNVTGGAGGAIGITIDNGILSVQGNEQSGSGGDALLTASGNLDLGAGSVLQMTGGAGGSLVVDGENGRTAILTGSVTAGNGGMASLNASSIDLGSNATLGLTGGTGGSLLLTASNGAYAINDNQSTGQAGAGGGVLAATSGDVTLNSGSSLLFQGGMGGQAQVIGNNGPAVLDGEGISGGSGGTVVLDAAGNIFDGSSLELQGGSGGDASVTAYLISGVYGGTTSGGSGGDAAVTAGSISITGPSPVLSSGGNGGDAEVGASGSYGLGISGNVQGGMGGTGSVTTGGLDVVSSSLDATGGNGGSVSIEADNGGIGVENGQVQAGTGGDGVVTSSAISLSGSTLAVHGGSGGSVTLSPASGSCAVSDGSVQSGNGGDAFIAADSATLSGSNLEAFGGTGGNISASGSGADIQGGTAIAAYGGYAQISLGSLTMDSASSLLADGGSGGQVTGMSGGNGGTGTAGVTIGDLEGSGIIDINGTFAYLQVGSGSFSGLIEGDTELIKVDSGALTLSGSNSFQGGAALIGGGLNLGNSSALGTGNVDLSNGTTLQAGLEGLNLSNNLLLAGADTYDANGYDSTLSGVLSGSGSLDKIGSGALTLSGINTYQGGTTLEGGALHLDDSQALGTGALAMNDGTTLQAGLENLSLSNSVLLSGSDIYDSNGYDSTLSGSLSGNGSLTKVSSGDLTLDGMDTYTGGTTVDAGLLILGDSSDPVSLAGGAGISAGATLMGFGTIAGMTTNNGMLVPGDGADGALTVDGYTQSASGMLEIGVTPTQWNSLNDLGSAQLDGALTVTATGTFGVKYSYVILNATTGVDGTFATLQDSIPGYLDPTLAYGTDAVTLTLTRTGVDFTTFAQTPNEKAVAAVLNTQVGNASTTFDGAMNALYLMPSGQAQALDEMGGVLYTALPDFMIEEAQFQSNLLFDRIGVGEEVGFGPMVHGMARSPWSAEVNGNAQTGSPNEDYWLEQTDSFGSVNGNSDVSGYNQNHYGVWAGYENLSFNQMLYGLSLGYSRDNLSSQGADGTAGVNDVQGDLYGGLMFDTWDLQGVAGYGFDQYTVDRTITLGSGSETAKGSFNGSQIDFNLRLADRLKAEDIAFKPLLGAQYVYLSTDKATESGAQGLDLMVPAQSVNSLRPYLGLEVDPQWSAGDLKFKPIAQVTVSQEVVKQNENQSMAFAGAPQDNFTIAGIPPGETIIGIEAGLGLELDAATRLYLDYNGNFSNSQNLNTVSGGLNLGI